MRAVKRREPVAGQPTADVVVDHAVKVCADALDPAVELRL
jgi:hypothetical protein